MSSPLLTSFASEVEIRMTPTSASEPMVNLTASGTLVLAPMDLGIIASSQQRMTQTSRESTDCRSIFDCRPLSRSTCRRRLPRGRVK